MIEVVAGVCALKPADLASRSRQRAVLVPRQLAMYRCPKYTGASLPEIGRDFNLICANFALLHQDIIPLLAAMNTLLAPGGALVIQTLHPWNAAAGDYQDGWREETFSGFGGQWQPMPWYMRTLSSWFNALDMAGFRLAGLQEPQHPQSPVPQSLLMVAESREKA